MVETKKRNHKGGAKRPGRYCSRHSEALTQVSREPKFHTDHPSALVQKHNKEIGHNIVIMGKDFGVLGPGMEPRRRARWIGNRVVLTDEDNNGAWAF